MKTLDSRRVFALTILLSWFTFVLVLIAGGGLSVFIRKGYAPLSVSALVLLAALAVRRGGSGPRDPVPDTVSLRALALFLFPIALAVVVRPGSLPILAAANRGVSTSLAAADESLVETLMSRAEIEGRYRKMNLKQLLSVTSGNPEKAHAMPVATEGLVFRKAESPPGTFMLVRFLITCCAADATPLGIRVEWAGASRLQENSWVLVRGEVSCAEGNPRIVAEEVQPVPKPADPYLY